MFCNLMFFYDKKEFENINKNLNGIKDNYRIVTNSLELNEFLKAKGKESFVLSDIIPEMGPLATETYKEAQELRNKYREHLKDVVFHDIEIFNGFDYIILHQLYLLIKAKKILEEKRNTVFIFSTYLPVYFAIKKLANDLGYNNEPKIVFFNNNEMKYLETEYENLSSNYRNKFSRFRVTHFVKNSFIKNPNMKNFKSVLQFFSKSFSFLIRMYLNKLFTKTDVYSMESIFKKIDKKIQKTASKYGIECAFFCTAVREDLFLKPWYPIFEKFKKADVKYQIFTGDLATSLTLSKEKICHVDLFEEINTLIGEIQKIPQGQEIIEQIKNAIKLNTSTLGFKELEGYALSQSLRSVVIIALCDHIISKMKLKSMVAIADGEMLECLAVKVSQKYKIPTFTMEAAAMGSQPIFSDWLHVNKIFVPGTQVLETLTGLGYDKNRIILCGNPKFDHFMNMDSKKSKAFLENSHKIDSKKKLVVVGMSRWHTNDELWMSDLIKFCNKNNFEIVIKIHPSYKIDIDGISENKIKSIKKKCQNLLYNISYDMNLYTLLSAADIIITEYSNIGVEASILEKPIVIVNFLKEDTKLYPERLDEYGAAMYVEEYSELERVILEILNKNMHLDKLKVARKIVYEKHNIHNDGKAAERISNVLTQPREN